MGSTKITRQSDGELNGRHENISPKGWRHKSNSPKGWMGEVSMKITRQRLEN